MTTFRVGLAQINAKGVTVEYKRQKPCRQWRKRSLIGDILAISSECRGKTAGECGYFS